MRLINVATMELEEFNDDTHPDYAILSHTWEWQEVSFEAWGVPDSRKELRGFKKIEGMCRYSKEKFQMDYVWVDTCCINKNSSSELAEAINSMYRWYEMATICIAYISDAYADLVFLNSFEWIGLDTTMEELCRSRWFTRGWTLQELIAPWNVEFVDSDWNYFGSLHETPALAEAIAKRTAIPESVLLGRSFPSDYSIANRMSWASQRTTTRIEDEAYCLLGLFGVSMPLIYGEGTKAFIRLQEEIIRRSTDQSIFVHSSFRVGKGRRSLLAPSARNFSYARNKDILLYQRDMPLTQEAFEVTNVGLRITLPVIKCPSRPNIYHALLRCCFRTHDYGPLGITMESIPENIDLNDFSISPVFALSHPVNRDDLQCPTLDMMFYLVGLNWHETSVTRSVTILRDPKANLEMPLGTRFAESKKRVGMLLAIQRLSGGLFSAHALRHEFMGEWLRVGDLPAIWKADSGIGAVAITNLEGTTLAFVFQARKSAGNTEDSGELPLSIDGIAVMEINSGSLQQACESPLLKNLMDTRNPSKWRFQDTEFQITVAVEPEASRLDARVVIQESPCRDTDLPADVRAVDRIPIELPHETPTREAAGQRDYIRPFMAELLKNYTKMYNESLP